MNYLKIFAIMFLLLGTNIVVATTDNPYTITDVEVEDISTVDPNMGAIFVERGETIKIEVFLVGGNVSSENVRIEAELGGYNRDTVRETTDSFDVEAGVTYPAKKLMLELPDDLEPAEDYLLRIRAYDRNNDIDYDHPILLRVREKEHLLKIEDVNFDPNLNQVNAGDRLYANVRVTNKGFTTENDVKVVMEIPTLNLYTASYIDELNTESECDSSTDEDCDYSKTEQVSLIIPETASGDHDVTIRVEYDSGDEVLEQTYALSLGEAPVSEEATTIIDVTPEEQTVAPGEGVAYKIVITNLANEERTYTLSAKGLENWATFDIQPGFVTVAPDSTQEVFVFVTANKDATPGTNFFTVSVQSGSETKEITLQSEVEGDKTTTGGTDFNSIRAGLEIGFIVLLIILVILGIVLAVKRTGRRDDDLEEPAEGKSYY